MRRLAVTVAVACAVALPASAQAYTRAQERARAAIVDVWGAGARGRLGLRIAWCESRFLTAAINDTDPTDGPHLGLFQMGAAERRAYGDSATAVGQARAALRYFLVSGTSPWWSSRTCWQ